MPTRTWKSNPLIGALLIIVAIVAAWLTYQNVKRPRRSVEYSYVLMCTKCEAIFEASYPEGQRPPFPCPYCKSQSYPALRCRACGRIFPSLHSPSREVPYVCADPDCGKRASFPLRRWEMPSRKRSSGR